MKNFTRAKKIGNEDFQQNGNVLGVSGNIETNVRPLTEAAKIGAEFPLLRYNFLGLKERSSHTKPAVLVSGG